MKPIVGWAAVSGLLLETATRDLAGISGAFTLSSAEWMVICFIGGVVFAALAAWQASYNETKVSERRHQDVVEVQK